MKSGSGGVEVVIAAGEQPPAPAEETNLLRVPSDLLRWFGLPPQRKGSDLREQIAREIAKEISYSWIETEELETADEAAAVAVVEKGVETVEAVEAEEAAATAMQKIVRGQSSRRQSEPKHAAAEDAQVPLRDSPLGDRVAFLRTLFGALELELGTELAAAELNISRWEPLQALAVERLDVCQFARQTLRRVHELALEPHAPHGQVRPLTPLRGGDRPHT
jgi:hypothetical protein